MKKALFAFILSLIIQRFFLPDMLQSRIVDAVNNTEGFRCELDDVDLVLYRGADKLNNFKVINTENNVQLPIFKSRPNKHGYTGNLIGKEKRVKGHSRNASG